MHAISAERCRAQVQRMSEYVVALIIQTLYIGVKRRRLSHSNS